MKEIKTGCRISGTGHAVPDKILTNDDLSHMVDTSDEWITTRTGIKERHILTENETLTDLSAKAGRDALENAGVLPEDIDYIICATVKGDFTTPSLACCVQKEMGLTCPAFDINAACAGFLYALDVAASLIKTKKNVRRVLVIATEAISRLIDWNDRNTCVLFGDGSGAAVVERSEEDCFMSFVEHSSGNCEVLNIKTREDGRQCMFMNGKEVFKFAVTSACSDINEAMNEAGIEDKSEIDYVILHQANKRITDAVTAKLGIDEEKYISTIHKYGNTSASGIIIALDELSRSGRLKKGDKIAFAAFGGGLVSAASIICWNK